MTSELDGTFRELGLSQYLDAFVDQGFDTWDTILDIQESDLDALGVKLGHRRKLQRRIANARGIAPSVSLGSSKQNPEDSKRDGPKSSTGRSESGHEGNGGVVKRKYRRHPKPDENAPERPPSAYVLFSNKMREDLKGHNLTFTEIAKLVGENWQSLPPAEKEAYESQANTAKEKYHRDLVEYKKTPEYRKYTQYLQEFKEKQAKQNQDSSKRPKAEPARLRHGSTSSSAATGTTNSSGSGSGSIRDSRCSSEQFTGSDAPPAIDTMAANGHLPPLNDDSRSSPRSAPLDMMAGREMTGRGVPLKDVIGGGHGLDNRGQNQNLPSLMDVVDEDGRPLKDGIPYTTSGFVPANSRPPIPDAPAFGRAPQLRHEQSSTGSSGSTTSASSANSFGRPPGEGPLPIHALLSGRAAGASPSTRHSSTSPTFSATPSPMEPGKPAAMGPRGYGFQSAPSALQHLKIEQSNGGDVVMTSPGLSPAVPKGSNKDGLDGMSALLRAGEIVGRRNGE